jgi:hypothetical protein
MLAVSLQEISTVVRVLVPQRAAVATRMPDRPGKIELVPVAADVAILGRVCAVQFDRLAHSFFQASKERRGTGKPHSISLGIGQPFSVQRFLSQLPKIDFAHE